MNTTRLLVGVLCAGLLASAAGPTLATTSTTTYHPQESESTDWADHCENASVLDTGTYEGSLSPGDNDAFVVENISEGEYIALNFTFTGGADHVEITNGTGDEVAEATFTAGTGEPVEDAYGNTRLYGDGDYLELGADEENDLSVYSIRVYAEDENPICIQFYTDGTSAASWRMSMAPQAAQAPTIICPRAERADATS